MGAYIVSEEEDIIGRAAGTAKTLCKYFIVDNVGACDDVGRATVIAKMWKSLGKCTPHGVIA